MLKGFFSLGSAAIFIGMDLQSSCLVGALDLRDISVRFNAQHFVMRLWRVMRHFGCCMSVVLKMWVDLCVAG